MTEAFVTMEEADAETPLAPARPVRLPPELVEALVGYALQTAPGQALWRGYLLGAGLPKGEGGVTVREAVYVPKTAAGTGAA